MRGFLYALKGEFLNSGAYGPDYPVVVPTSALVPDRAWRQAASIRQLSTADASELDQVEYGVRTVRQTMMAIATILVALGFCATVRAEEGVILLHGLARTSRSMERMEAAFGSAGYVVVNVDYPSRDLSIAALGESVIGGALSDVRLRTCTRIHFVAHSLGCILVRSYFASGVDARLGRVVMLGPPNQGSEVVDRLKSWWVFPKINGPAGAELGTGINSVPRTLGPVKFESGVIAGDRTINWINSLMIAGPDDGKVSVERTKVEGMKEHIVAHVSHPFIMRNPRVIESALRFVRSGSFASNPRPTQRH